MKRACQLNLAGAVPLSVALRAPPLPHFVGARKGAKPAAAFPRPLEGGEVAREARRRGGLFLNPMEAHA